MFRLLGFPVHVRAGFVMFMVLIVILYGGEFGLWLAGSLAIFTLIHELGHAVAARAAGADAEISLNFLAGYASYRPTRPISRLEHAGISFAGPAVQIVTSVAILLAMGVNPLVRESIDDSPASWAIWWAGPVIGLLNLIPVLPLDGGNIVQTALDRIVGDRVPPPDALVLPVDDRCVRRAVLHVRPGQGPVRLRRLPADHPAADARRHEEAELTVGRRQRGTRQRQGGQGTPHSHGRAEHAATRRRAPWPRRCRPPRWPP